MYLNNDERVFGTDYVNHHGARVAEVAGHAARF
jgi:hypothetical protein